MILTSLAATATVIGVIYGFLQNFKAEIKVDINNHIDRLETRMDKLEERLDARVNKLEERMFWLATGKKLEDAILEEQMKRKKSA
ncbi:hypothetical protein RHABOEDO_000903 [Candidatus Rhabdochlamydia oedothoracis]|uniref:Uncharacterized protein n=2 Tax=Candidatus Rhabdochlamydiaceae TaxID=689704 RepID=A0ABX8V647_9BACT|nr:hypothetical protein RHABOEDO_000903 [Candidatus Rhabdochlamydia oedothoracis]